MQSFDCRTCITRLSLICWLLGAFNFTGYTQSGSVQWLNRLDSQIQMAGKYDALKLARIDSLCNVKTNSNRQLFRKYLGIYNEFSLLNFDSSYFYASKMSDVASAENDSALLKYARIKTSFVLLSAGMFKEVFDSLNYLNPGGLDGAMKAEYYVLMTRGYFDLSDYNREKIFSSHYISEADRYIDSLIMVASPGSFDRIYYSGLRDLRRGDVRSAAFYFKQLVSDSTLTLNQDAIVNSTYSDIFIRMGKTDSAIILLCKAAIADIRSSTKETTAILNLARLLFKSGDIRRASLYIQKANDDAKSYGARQRILELSYLSPLIEEARYASVEKDRMNLMRYAIIITILLAFLLFLSIIVFRQFRKMKIQQDEINSKNLSLHHMVDEKEWLLKEIHHRVKNNLHTITSLLESQSAHLENDALKAIRESQHRVFAMSLIHQKLYQPEKNVVAIDMPIYIHELVDYLKESFEAKSRIRFHIETEPLELDISLAVPVGLILNEAITNAMKYAFPEEKEGVVTIIIKKTGIKTLLFSVSDNGVGLPDGFEVNNVKSLGVKLMKGLSDDISAKFQIESVSGTRISIEFMSDKSIRQLQQGFLFTKAG